MSSVVFPRGRRVFVIGAGMSAECGAPLTRDILTSRFMGYGKQRSRDTVLSFLSSASVKKKRLDPEALWTELDENIRKRLSFGDYEYRELRKIRDALFTLITDEIAAVHSRFVDCLESCGVRLSEGFTYNPKLLEEYLTNPRGWLEWYIKQDGLPTDCDREFLLLMIPSNKDDTKRAFIGRFTEFLATKHDRGYARTLATGLGRVLFTPVKVASQAGVRKVFFDSIDRLAVQPGEGKLLNLEWQSRQSFDHILWRKYLLQNHGRELAELSGWFATYFAFVQKLRPGDTIITTNYDLFLDVAFLLSSSWLNHGILTGTSFMQLDRLDRLQKVHGTSVDLAESLMRESNAESSDDWLNDYMKRAFQKTRSADKWLWFLKLHGSLNWGICHSCQELFSGHERSFPEVKRAIMNHRTYSKGYKTHILCCPKASLHQLMIPPTSMKDYSLKPLTNIWRTAEQRICDSGSLAFIGYSLPETDTKMMELIKKAQYKRRRKAWANNQIWCVNRSPLLVEERYKDLFGAVTLFSGKASEFIKAEL